MRWFAVLALTLALAACGNDTGRLQGWVEGDFVFVGPDEAGRVELLLAEVERQLGELEPLTAQTQLARKLEQELEKAQEQLRGVFHLLVAVLHFAIPGDGRILAHLAGGGQQLANHPAATRTQGSTYA